MRQRDHFCMQLSQTEENYLKAIFKLSEQRPSKISTTSIAKIVETSAASVTDMLKRLAEKELVIYKKYKGAKLTPAGLFIATNMVRKHRLWEVFLVDKLNFSWEQVHEVAEELEHVNSDKLIDQLDQFLGYPKFDPHGDPIPSASGKFTLREQIPLSEITLGVKTIVIGVKHQSQAFLKRLDALHIALGSHITLNEKFDFENTFEIEIGKERKIISSIIADNVLVKIAK